MVNGIGMLYKLNRLAFKGYIMTKNQRDPLKGFRLVRHL
jgi:hypothetical protein